ncbi:hypothetical protein [Lacrimispora algidixylanolytica]|uniref:Uncharacterized protein n=1 Tax=Lacrimispora algidixylanolytica TaxID=94868 RepID=A0A419T2S4_9FIRM|nr:hypothetical protein [Lacrimispora algidixylanolytica]RKD31850.1 hypothetical protein BET01_18950 [Lacrimispora algidixylanolytica]
MKRRDILMTIGFTLLLVLLFGVVLVLMISSGEQWFAYLILAACLVGTVKPLHRASIIYI